MHFSITSSTMQFSYTCVGFLKVHSPGGLNFIVVTGLQPATKLKLEPSYAFFLKGFYIDIHGRIIVT